MSSKPGRPGENGLDGLSAFEIAKALGFGGTEREWLASLVGPRGEEGKRGEKGENGKDADQAEVQRLVDDAVAQIPAPKDGAVGPRGARGPAGKDGAAAPPAPAMVPWRARYIRDEVTKRTTRVEARPTVGNDQGIDLIPELDADQLIKWVDLVPA